MTDDPERLLPTLRSRTVPITFGLVDGERPGVAIRLRDPEAKEADDARTAAVQLLMTGPKGARLRAAAAMAKGDDAASRDELADTAVRMAQLLHTTFGEKMRYNVAQGAPIVCDCSKTAERRAVGTARLRKPRTHF